MSLSGCVWVRVCVYGPFSSDEGGGVHSNRHYTEINTVMRGEIGNGIIKV